MASQPRDMRNSSLDEFCSVLTSAVRSAYDDLNRDRGGEQFYAVGLAFPDEPSSLAIAANSKDALERVVDRYVANGADAETVRMAIMWSRVPEWGYHNYGEASLVQANRLLDDLYSAHKAWVWSHPPEDRPGATMRELDERVLVAVRDVLRLLDGEQAFVPEESRDDAVLNLWSSIGDDRGALERAAWFNAPGQLLAMRRALGPPA